MIRVDGGEEWCWVILWEIFIFRSHWISTSFPCNREPLIWRYVDCCTSCFELCQDGLHKSHESAVKSRFPSFDFFLPFSCNFFSSFSIPRFIDEKRVECRVMRLSSSHYLPLCLHSFIAVWQLNDSSFLFVGIFRMQKSEWKWRRRQLLTEVALSRRLCDIETLLRFTENSK